MSDLTTLRDAFAELERRADAHEPGKDGARTTTRPGGGNHRTLLAVASVVAVAGIATALALVTGDNATTDGNRNGPAAGAPPSAHASTHPSAHPSTHATPSPRRPVLGKSIPIAPPPATTSVPVNNTLPTNAADLAQRLRTLLGHQASFTYTAPAGKNVPYIVGVLTRTSTHHRGGFDLQVNPGSRGDKAICEDPGESKCTVRRLTDGSSLSIGREHGGGLLYLVNLVRPDGTSLLMHESTRSDPKGAGQTFGSKPPFSPGDLVKWLMSPTLGQ